MLEPCSKMADEVKNVDRTDTRLVPNGENKWNYGSRSNGDSNSRLGRGLKTSQVQVAFARKWSIPENAALKPADPALRHSYREMRSSQSLARRRPALGGLRRLPRQWHEPDLPPISVGVRLHFHGPPLLRESG